VTKKERWENEVVTELKQSEIQNSVIHSNIEACI